MNQRQRHIRGVHVQYSLRTLPLWWRLKLAFKGTLHLLVEVTGADRITVTAVRVTPGGIDHVS